MVKAGLWKHLIVDWKPTLTLWVPVFAGLMWYGFAHGFDDLWLYAIVLALAAWEVCGRAVLVVRKWQQWRAQKRTPQVRNSDF